MPQGPITLKRAGRGLRDGVTPLGRGVISLGLTAFALARGAGLVELSVVAALCGLLVVVGLVAVVLPSRVRADLTAVLYNRSHSFRGFIVSRSGKLDPAHPIFSTPGGEIHLLVTDDFAGDVDLNVTIHRQTLAGFLETLATEYHVHHLHCEGGGELVRALAELDVIDEFHLTLAGHTLFGGLAASTATGIPAEFLPKSVDFKISDFEPRPATGECFLSYTRV